MDDRDRDELHRRARDLRREGLTQSEIAARLELPKSTVRVWLTNVPRGQPEASSWQYRQAEIRERARTVACPRCAAEPGAACVDLENKPMMPVHSERTERADRADLAAGSTRVDDTGRGRVRVRQVTELSESEARRYGLLELWRKRHAQEAA